MTLQEKAHRAHKSTTSGVIVLTDNNRIAFDTVRSYRDDNGDFSITIATPTGEKAYHSDQIKDIELG